MHERNDMLVERRAPVRVFCVVKPTLSRSNAPLLIFETIILDEKRTAHKQNQKKTMIVHSAIRGVSSELCPRRASIPLLSHCCVYKPYTSGVFSSYMRATLYQMSYSDYDIVSSTKLTKNKTLIKTLIGTNNFDLHVTITSTEQKKKKQNIFAHSQLLPICVFFICDL